MWRQSCGEKSTTPARRQAPAKAFFDPPPGRRVVSALRTLIGQPVRSAEHAAFPVRQVGERRHQVRVQGNPARLAVLRVEEDDVAAGEIDLAPVEPEGFADATAGEEQDRGYRRHHIERACQQPLRNLERLLRQQSAYSGRS